MLEELKDGVVESARTIHFAEGRSEAAKEGLRVLMHSNVQTDSIALMALLEIDGTDARLPKIMAGIMDDRDPKKGGRWAVVYAPENVTSGLLGTNTLGIVGYDADSAMAMLASGELEEAVRAAEQEARALDIHAVPTFVIEGRFAIPGAQDPETFVSALARLQSKLADEAAD